MPATFEQVPLDQADGVDREVAAAIRTGHAGPRIPRDAGRLPDGRLLMPDNSVTAAKLAKDPGHPIQWRLGAKHKTARVKGR